MSLADGAGLPDICGDGLGEACHIGLGHDQVADGFGECGPTAVAELGCGNSSGLVRHSRMQAAMRRMTLVTLPALASLHAVKINA